MANREKNENFDLERKRNLLKSNQEKLKKEIKERTELLDSRQKDLNQKIRTEDEFLSGKEEKIRNFYTNLFVGKTVNAYFDIPFIISSTSIQTVKQTAV